MCQMGSCVHAQGPYKHLTPGNPDVVKRCKFSVFQTLLRQAISSKVPTLRASTRKGTRCRALPSHSPPLHRFLSPRQVDICVSVSLHHSTDRWVGQVELACDVSRWVLLQR